MAAATERRRERTWGVVIAVVAVAVLVLFLVVRAVVGLIPSLSDPFATETVDRTGPALLRALDDLSEYRAAEGQFQVVVDVEERTRFLPSFLKGERSVFLAGGTVAASVDFSNLDEDAIRVSEEGTTAHIELPAASLSEAVVRPERSYVIDRDRGVLDRLGSVVSDSPTSERELYLLAGEKLEAAARESELVDRAEENTEAMLGTMLGALGYEDVTVSFVEDPAPRT
jgi:hypothetical protein